MKLKLERLYLKPDYTIGKLYIDGKYFCDTLEDRDWMFQRYHGFPIQNTFRRGLEYML